MNKRSQTLRRKTIERNNFTCKKCKIYDKTGKTLEVHHTKPIVMGGKDELNNLITLCTDCHHFVPNKEEEFNEYMKEEMDGTSTTLIKAWKKVINEHPELIEKINKEKAVK